MFSLDWDNILGTDPIINRQTDGTLEQLDTSQFIAGGTYLFCLRPPYQEYDGYTAINNAYWDVISSPGIHIHTANIFILNQRVEKIFLTGPIDSTAEFKIYTGSIDCNSGNEIGTPNLSDNREVLYIWFPETT